MTTITKSVALAVACALAGGAAAEEPPCRGYRLAVRTGTDPTVGRIDLERARKSSIAELLALPTPDPQTLTEDRRAPAEAQVYRVRALLVLQRTGEHRDYSLVLRDEDKRSLVAEIPDPSCVPVTSPFFRRLQEAYRRLDERLHMDQQSIQVGLTIPVEVTGVGFFDLEGSSSEERVPGMAPNFFAINPILDIKFR